jgi:phytoene synthase
MFTTHLSPSTLRTDTPSISMAITFLWPIWVPLSLKIAFWIAGEAYWLVIAALAVATIVWAIERTKNSDPLALTAAKALNRRWDEDVAHCTEVMRKGSKSFFMATRLLPVWMRTPTLALYAYCRHGDDVVDDLGATKKHFEGLLVRLDTAYNSKMDVNDLPTPMERMFAAVVRAFDVPKALPRALLDGFEWDLTDAVGRYETVDDTVAYGVRVASAVGGMMVTLMPHELRRPEVMARAFDLGIAMQLTNISRDVGEDARNGRCYLPNQWLKEEGVDRAQLLKNPEMTPAVGRVVKRLLDKADEYYKKADAGIKFLPKDCQLAVQAAGCIYRDIGHVVEKNGYDSISQRAFTSKSRKLVLVLCAYVKSMGANWVKCAAPPARPAVYLVKAVCQDSGW